MLYKILNNFDINFMMPISLIDENMKRAHNKDGYFKEKFWFRTNILPSGKCYKYNIMEETDYLRSNKFANGDDEENPLGCCFDENETYHELYLYEIFEGKDDLDYRGVFPLIEEYMEKRKFNDDIV